MISFANAKINLGLFVTEKRNDGYHSLESIFLPVDVSDVLEIIPVEEKDFSFNAVGIEINGSSSDNLCVKAYELLKKDFELSGLKVCLLKNIPIGAGLGGGSSDGVQMLKSLNELFKLNLQEEQLMYYAAKLGSDCPFFVQNKPTFVLGRGEILQPIDLNLTGVHAVVVHPGVHISTPTAYSLIKPNAASFDLRQIHQLPRSEWQENIINDFEKPMAEKFPIIGSIKNELIEQGAFYASMSGSGSAVYGLFEEEKNLAHFWPEFFYRNARIL